MPDEPVQRGQEGFERRPVPSISLPALEHQRVEGRGATVWGGQAILVCYCLHHLQRERARKTLVVQMVCCVMELRKKVASER